MSRVGLKSRESFGVGLIFMVAKFEVLKMTF